MKNPWNDCKYNPPPQYNRVEIKDKHNKHYIGYRYQNNYYETFGNYIIPEPYKWRWIPANSPLFYEIKNKLKMLIGTGVTALGFKEV